MYIDIHSHRYPGVSAAFTLLDCPPEIPLPQETPSLRFCSGIHPWRTGEPATETMLETVAVRAAQKRIGAIGECGIDRRRGAATPVQLALLRRQLEIAATNSLPVIIHCVRAWPELLAIRPDFTGFPWIIHGFSGNIRLAEQLLAAGCELSIAPSLLRRPHASALLEFLCKHRFLLETDAGDMDIITFYRRVAARINMEPERLKKRLLRYFTDIFGMSTIGQDQKS